MTMFLFWKKGRKEERREGGGRTEGGGRIERKDTLDNLKKVLEGEEISPGNRWH